MENQKKIEENNKKIKELESENELLESENEFSNVTKEQQQDIINEMIKDL